MKRINRRLWFWLGGGVLGLVLSAALVGGTVFAQEGTATPTTSANDLFQTFIDRLAQNLGISTDQLNQALSKTEQQTIDDAVSSGRLSQQQADALKQQIASGQTLAPLHELFGFGHGGCGVDASAIASVLGITPQQLQTELQSGKTLKQVIADHGKSVDEVVNAVVAQLKTKLDAQVQSGKITQDQENTILSQQKQRLTDAINNNTLGRMRGHGWHHEQGPEQQATPTASQSS